MGYDVYGLQPKNVEYLNENHPGDFDFSKFDFSSPEYQTHSKKEWEANATSGYYFRQSIGGYWAAIMSFADNVIENLPDEVMFNSNYIIEENDAIKVANHIEQVLNKDTFEQEAKEYVKEKYDRRVKEYGGEYNLEDEYLQFKHILSTFVNFAKNSGGFRIA